MELYLAKYVGLLVSVKDLATILLFIIAYRLIKLGIKICQNDFMLGLYLAIYVAVTNLYSDGKSNSHSNYSGHLLRFCNCVSYGMSAWTYWIVTGS